MTSPTPPQGPETGAVKNRAPNPVLKILVAAMILAIGSAVAVMYRLDDIDEISRTESSRTGISEKPSENPVFDPNLENAPLPSGTIRDDADEKIAATSDTGKEKYAQAYPPPILVADESLTSKESTPDSHRSKSVPIIEDFPTVQPFTTYKPIAVDKTSQHFQKPPEPLDLTQIYDEMLPLFRFAENLKANEDLGQPDNPFQTILIPDENDVSVLRPLQPLQPLYSPGKTPDARVLKPLQPLVSPVPSLKLTPLQPLE